MREHIVETGFPGEFNVDVNGVVIPRSPRKQGKGCAVDWPHHMRRQPVTDRDLFCVFSHVAPPKLF